MTFKEYVDYMNDSAIDFNKSVAITVAFITLTVVMLTLAIAYESGVNVIAAIGFTILSAGCLKDIWGSYKEYRQINEPTWALLQLIRSKPDCMERVDNTSVWKCGAIVVEWGWWSQLLDNHTYNLFNAKERAVLARPFRLHEQKERELEDKLAKFEYALKRDILAKQVEEQQ